MERGVEVGEACFTLEVALAASWRAPCRQSAHPKCPDT